MIVSGIIGAVTGLAGNIFTSWNNRKAKAADNAHEIKRIEAETNAMIAEANANIKITEAEVAGEIKVAELDIFKQSVIEGNKNVFDSKYMDKLFSTKIGSWVGTFLAFLFGVVDFVKAATRPSLTIGLIILAGWIITTGTIVDPTMKELIVYLATTSVVWWFGYRNESKSQAKRDKLIK